MKTIVAREVIEAKIIKDYTIKVVFDDFKKGIIDLRKYLGRGIFKELLDKKKFRQMKVVAELGTICWPNGADIAPDTLYSQISKTFISAVNNVNKKHMKTLKALA
jgi:hypothetical protein